MELETRKLVERGKGILQRDLGLREHEAFLALQRHSQQKKRAMKEIGQAIILRAEVRQSMGRGRISVIGCLPLHCGFAKSGARTRIAIGKKQAWWNQRLKGWWTLGGAIGYAIGVLIASQIARWLPVALLILGAFFAIVFRLVRPRNEI